MDLEFTSQKELYQRLLPALRTKKREMQRHGYSYIKEEDVWNYLKENKWKMGNNLSLHDLASDILNTEEAYIDYYLKRKLNERNRHLYFDDSKD